MTGALRRFFYKRRAELELDRELRFHVDQLVRNYVTEGLSPQEARRRANLSFGGLEQVKQECRESRFEGLIQDLLRDIQYAVRSLSKDRRFALIAIFSLALGVGAATIMFSVVYNVAAAPFPYRDFQRLAVIDLHDLAAPADDITRYHYTIPEFLAIRDQNHVFEEIVANYQLDVLYRDEKGTRRFLGGYVTTNGFEILGVPPLLGRFFGPADGKPDTPLVFMMNYALWQTEFQGDRSILGKTFLLNGKPRTLVGIMPQRFNMYGSSVWFPLDLRPGADGTVFPVHDPDILWTCARLKKGVSLEAAAADVNAILHRMAQANPGELYPRQFKIVVRTLLDFVLGEFSKVLYVLLAAVAMLFLISCGNVANLLLARATVREKEIAFRAALGAGRGRLIRQLLVESVLLAGAACLAACAFSYFGLKGLVAIIPRGQTADLFHGRIPEETVIKLNPAVLLFAVGVAALTILICGLAPTLHAVRKNLELRIFGSGRGDGRGSPHGNLRSGLVITEVALSMVLLIGACLMIRSFFALTHVEVGFNPARMLYAWVSTAARDPNETAAQKKGLYEQVLQRVRSLPGVTGATISLGTPPIGGAGSDIRILGKQLSPNSWSGVNLCSETYFQTLGIRLLRGRLLSRSDIDSVRPVAVVNEAFVHAYFGSENVLGQKIMFTVLDALPEAPHNTYFEVIGVVRDSKNRGLLEPPRPEAFVPSSISEFGNRTILASTSVDPSSLLAGVQREIWAVDPSVAVTRGGSIQDFLGEFEYNRRRLELIATSAFAGIGLALALVGVFSLMAYTVALRTHEIGVRVALGAQPQNVVAMILRQGLRLLVFGISIGALVSLGLARLIASQVPGVSVNDPLTFATVMVAFLVVGLAACFLPARRAAHLDPLIALRYE